MNSSRKLSTVLVVDSDAVGRNLVKGYLSKWGYDVLEAANSVEAVRLLQMFTDEIHLAILGDSEYPDTAKEIAGIRSTLPILVASPSLNAQANSDASATNLTFVQKPIVPLVLMDKARYLIQRSKPS